MSMKTRTRVLMPLLALALLLPAAQADDAGKVREQSFRLLNQGVAAYKRGEFALAAAKLEQSASIALSSFRSYYYWGLALNGARRYEEAIDALEIALDLDPTHLQSLVAVGDANLKLGDLDEARGAYFRAMKIRPEYAPALDGIARVFEARSDDSEAVLQFRRAIASNLGFAPAYTHLGDLYLRQSRFEEAVQLLEEAVSIRPDYGPGLNRLALAYGRLGLANEAIATIQQALELEPRIADHRVTLGSLQLDQGFPSSAAESFQRALALDPALAQARLGLAEVARRRGDYQTALDQVDIALADPRTDAAMILRLSEFRVGAEEERDEIERIEARVADEEATGEEFAALAAIYAGRNNWIEAAKLQRNAPASVEHDERLAFMLFRANRFAESQQLYQELSVLSPTVAMELNNGVTLALLGNDEAAVEAYQRALEIDPENRRVLLYLGNAQLRLGRQEDAVAAYRQVLQKSSRGADAERVRRILKQIAPQAVEDLPAEGDAADEAGAPS